MIQDDEFCEAFSELGSTVSKLSNRRKKYVAGGCDFDVELFPQSQVSVSEIVSETPQSKSNAVAVDG